MEPLRIQVCEQVSVGESSLVLTFVAPVALVVAWNKPITRSAETYCPTLTWAPIAARAPADFHSVFTAYGGAG